MLKLEDIINMIDTDFYLFKELSKEDFEKRFKKLFRQMKETYSDFKNEIEQRIQENYEIYYPKIKLYNDSSNIFEKHDKIVEDSINSQSSKSFKPEWETPKMNIISTPLEDNMFYKEYLKIKEYNFERSVKDRNEKISEDDLLNLEIAFNSATNFEDFLNLI